MSGPLTGVRVVELAGIGPAPFAGMVLSDLGAEVLRVDRAAAVHPGAPPPRTDVLGRGRRSVGIDLKHPDGADALLRLAESADALIEGFRPGVAERLGVGPDDCLARNPGLVYGRMTGWGQEGPCAGMAGHDINYVALSGTLSLIGRAGAPPVPPVNLVGDFGGGGMLLAVGVLAALLEASRSGQGQVVDAAMVDGAALLAAMVWGFRAAGAWGERGTNLLDTGAWYYEVYETADGGHISLGSLEPQFLAEMLRLTGFEDPPAAGDRSAWPATKERLGALVRSRTRDEWVAILDGSDACFAPVLGLDEAPSHPHHVARGTFVDVDGVVQPAPAPRFSRTPGAVAGPPAAPGQHTDAALADWGFSPEEVAALRRSGAVA
ncbi:MAG: CaiB/BaiF CoA transferase family protein [Acidimicrobiales bacterium]